MEQVSSLTSLPCEILQRVTACLSLTDASSFRRVCKALDECQDETWFWCQALQRLRLLVDSVDTTDSTFGWLGDERALRVMPPQLVQNAFRSLSSRGQQYERAVGTFFDEHFLPWTALGHCFALSSFWFQRMGNQPCNVDIMLMNDGAPEEGRLMWRPRSWVVCVVLLVVDHFTPRLVPQCNVRFCWGRERSRDEGLANHRSPWRGQATLL
jgi:hypothetical protein